MSQPDKTYHLVKYISDGSGHPAKFIKNSFDNIVQ